MSNDRRACRLGRGMILQIRISVDRDVLGSFKCLHVGRHIDIERFSVDEEETFGVSETGKLRKIVRFNFGQTRRTDFRYARGFVQRHVSCEPGFLEFLAETFNRHCERAG